MFVKVKNFFWKFSRFWTRSFGLLFTFIMLLMRINLNFVDIDGVVRNLFGMAIVKTGPRQNGEKRTLQRNWEVNTALNHVWVMKM